MSARKDGVEAGDPAAAVRLVDAAATGRVLVFGSLPPAGRDLDLLARTADALAIRRALARAGFEARRSVLVRFGPGVDAVEVVEAPSWGLGQGALDELFRDAHPLPGSSLVVRPAPHHHLLILARRIARGTPPARFRERIAEALLEDPRAFDRAAERAAAWGATVSLAGLERAFRESTPPSAVARVRALVEEGRARRGSRLQALAWVTRSLLHGPRAGAVVALSGLDGSGKSLQAKLLAEALEMAGQRCVVEWPAIDAPSRLLQASARVARRTMGERRRAAAAAPGERGVVTPPSAETGGRRPLAGAWTTALAVRGALRVARKTWPHVLRGRLVVCDRYLLDALVHLLDNYGPGPYRVQIALLQWAAPHPVGAFLLEVSPETASARQPERTIEENRRRADLYRALAPRFDARTVDAERPPREINAELAVEVWRLLGGRD